MSTLTTSQTTKRVTSTPHTMGHRANSQKDAGSVAEAVFRNISSESGEDVSFLRDRVELAKSREEEHPADLIFNELQANQLNRRDMLKTALLTGAAVVVAPTSVLGADENEEQTVSNEDTNTVDVKGKAGEDQTTLTEQFLEHLNPNLTEVVPAMITMFNESWRLIDNNFKNDLDVDSLRYSNADTMARSISWSLTYFFKLGSRPVFTEGGKMLTDMSKKDLSDFATISAFHFQTFTMMYGSNPLIKIFREAYIEAMQDDQYGNDPRKVPISQLLQVIKNNKDKITAELGQELQTIKGIPQSYLNEGWGRPRGYVDHLIFVLSYVSAGENLALDMIGAKGNTGLGRFVADINRAGLMYRNLLVKDSGNSSEYDEQLIRSTAESITWPALYFLNGASQSAIDAVGLIKNTDTSLAMANLRELTGNLVFMGIYLFLKTPAQTALENKIRHDNSKGEIPAWQKTVQKYIEP